MAYLGEDIPKLGFGLMRLPRLDDDTIDIEQTKKMVDVFMQAGGKYFDTARAYGPSEDAIRQALVERYPRDSYYLASKNAAWSGAKDAEEARAMFTTSLEKTGVSYFDFYLIHNTGNTRTAVFDKFKIWDFFKELKEQGKVKHIGLSHHDSAEVLDGILTAHPEMEFVQLQVNYADWENGNTQSRKCVEVAHDHGLPVIIMEPIRGGLLANPPEEVADILKAANPDESYSSWALRFAMSVPGIITVLSGMSTLQQMEENVKLLKGFKPLSDDERATLERAQKKLEELLDNNCTSCKYCMKGCPKEIPICEIMKAFNNLALYGMKGARSWYRFSTSEGHRASDCIKCGQCENACPQHIPIIDKLEKAVPLFEEGESTPVLGH
ncbi:MAG: aldo/keto reductase [Coriobacteriales bacterium]|jgi:predicted aldo/keto reductase-like oxidoreductase